MKNTNNYEAPALEVVELEIENAILTASGEFSVPEFEQSNVSDFEDFF